MIGKREPIPSGVRQLDQLMGGLFIGDNVVWYDTAGSLASVFCLNFIQASQRQRKPVIYVSFDRTPKNLLKNFGPFAKNPYLTILDCFTHGKGDSSPIFLKFYEEYASSFPCRIVIAKDPKNIHAFMDTLYSIHEDMKGEVYFVFESMTGMQELWGGEEQLVRFYTHSCPRLYELSTIAYWTIEKDAHSTRLRAQINQIAQVVIELSIKRGKSSLTIVKAENREAKELGRPYNYWAKDLSVTFYDRERATGQINLGCRLKEFRAKRDLSQSQLAKLVGVTTSNISQVESNIIYPSLHTLFKIAEVLSVEPSTFFSETVETDQPLIISVSEATEVELPNLSAEGISMKLLTSSDFNLKAEPYLIEIEPKTEVPGHFLLHKGDELGHLISGSLELELEMGSYTLKEGETICLKSKIPKKWRNPGTVVARLLWVKLMQEESPTGLGTWMR